MPRPRTHVRCLGWDFLPFSFDQLSKAVVAVLNKFGVKFAITSRAGDLGWSFCVQPPAEFCDTNLLPPEEPLVVGLWVFAAEDNGKMHHVNLRRTQGEQHHFYYFYASFRRQFSEEIGMIDFRQLSLHSPLQRKRELQPDVAPAAGFTNRGSPSVRAASQPSPRSRSASSSLSINPSICQSATGSSPLSSSPRSRMTIPPRGDPNQTATAAAPGSFLTSVRRTARVPPGPLALPGAQLMRRSPSN